MKNSDVLPTGRYPMIQGTKNQLNLASIGKQDYAPENLQKAVKWMLESQEG